jgi:hypothetical protein
MVLRPRGYILLEQAVLAEALGLAQGAAVL